MSRKLKKLLEEEAGVNTFQMVIPYPFLPPRFRNVSNNRNMIIVLDQDMTVHVQWEGARLHTHCPLTPRATKGLLKDILKRMTTYRGDIQVFSKFIEKWAEQPFAEERPLDTLGFRVREIPPAAPEETEEAVEIVASVDIIEAIQSERFAELGGESPMPMLEEFYE